jgi:hypothetical protein
MPVRVWGRELPPNGICLDESSGRVFYRSVSGRSKGGRYVEECLGLGCKRWHGG